MSPGSRLGASLAETLVALLLGLALMHLALSATERVRAAHAALTLRAEAVLSFRIASTVLRTELRSGREGRDWIVTGDAVIVRAFRGTGVVCTGAGEPDAVLVSYSGYRAPDPAKDSLLVISADGSSRVTALRGTSAGAAACQGAPLDRPLVLELEHGVATPVLIRVFEHGSYAVSGSALRYERGGSGRQPLTPEIWTPSSRLVDGASLGASLRDREGRAWDLFLAPMDGV